MKFLLAVSALVLATSRLATAQSTVYFQPFDYKGPTGSTNTQSLNTAFTTTGATELASGWAGFSGATALDGSNTTKFAVSDRQTPNGPTSGPDQYGFAYINVGTPGPVILASTPTAFSLDSGAANISFSWYQGDQNATDAVQLAVLVGGQWYASATTFTTPAQGATPFGASPGSTGVLETLNFSTTASSWKLLSFTPGSQLAQGATATTNLSGAISGFGFFAAATPAGNLRFDSFTVVPEPGSTALAMTSLLGMAGFARRRRSL